MKKKPVMCCECGLAKATVFVERTNESFEGPLVCDSCADLFYVGDESVEAFVVKTSGWSEAI